MTINSIEISLREQTATISLFAGCGGSNVSSIVCADSKEAVSEYKKLSKSHNPKLWEEKLGDWIRIVAYNYDSKN